jgi:hypothetical protein
LNPFEILLKHERLCLLPSFKISAHLTSYNERSCYLLEVTPNWDLNIKWLTTRSLHLQTPWDFGRHIRDMSSIFVQNFNSIGDDHKELSLKKLNWLQNWGWNFRYLNLSQYRSKWLEISLTYIILYDL